MKARGMLRFLQGSAEDSTKDTCDTASLRLNDHGPGDREDNGSLV